MFSLSAAPQTASIKKERDFIEATSRLYSFKIYSHPGVPITPIEIRLSSDRLSFISRLLSSNDDAYRHPDVILELVTKLGYRGDKLAETRALAMMADSGLQAGDFVRAAEMCERIVAAVEGLRKSSSSSHARSKSVVGGGEQAALPSTKMVEEASELAWRNCFQVGKHEDFPDLDRRMKLLGLAIALCPGDKIPTLLPVWSSLEDRVSRLAPPTSDVKQPPAPHHHHVSAAAYYKLPSQISPALAVESASRTLNRAAAFFPFGVGGGGGNKSEAGSAAPSARSSSPARGLKNLASRGSGHRETGSGGGSIGSGLGFGSRLTAGVGWLIGADEVLEQRYRDSS